MVKRRNSPYAPFDRKAQRRVPVDFTPTTAPPSGRRTSTSRRRAQSNEFMGPYER
jgi:hypothetical protein